MRKVVKLTERDLTRLVKRILKEEGEGMETSSNLPNCIDLMKNESDMVGSSLNLQGPFDKIKANLLVAPKYQGFTVYRNNKEYCFIPKHR